MPKDNIKAKVEEEEKKEGKEKAYDHLMKR